MSKLEPKSDGSGFLKSGSAKKIRIGEKNPDASGSESLRRNRIRSRLQQLAPGKNINTVIYDRQSVVLKSGFLTDTVPYRYFFIVFFLNLQFQVELFTKFCNVNLYLKTLRRPKLKACMLSVWIEEPKSMNYLSRNLYLCRRTMCSTRSCSTRSHPRPRISSSGSWRLVLDPDPNWIRIHKVCLIHTGEKKIIYSGSKILLFFLISVLRKFCSSEAFFFYCKASGAKIILWSRTRPVPVNSNSALAPRLQAKIRFLVFFFNTCTVVAHLIQIISTTFKKVSFLHSFSAFTVYCSFKSIVNLNYSERPHKFSVVNKKNHLSITE